MSKGLSQFLTMVLAGLSIWWIVHQCNGRQDHAPSTVPQVIPVPVPIPTPAPDTHRRPRRDAEVNEVQPGEGVNQMWRPRPMPAPWPEVTPDSRPRPSPGGPRERAVVSKEPKDPQSGAEVDCDLPVSQHLKNHAAGGGCCVFASCDHMARYHDVKPLIGILDDDLGGGYPEKLAKHVERRFPGYKGLIQCTKPEEGVELMKWAMKTGRMIGCTYGYGERYGVPINHCVNQVAWNNGRVAVLDNNFPGTWEWMSEAEFFRRWKMQGGSWCFCLLEPPPPPIPVN